MHFTAGPATTPPEAQGWSELPHPVLPTRSGSLQPSEPQLPDLQEPFLALCVLTVVFLNNSHHALGNVQCCGHPCPGFVVGKQPVQS